MYTVEWQKYGLPHVHILLWLIDRINPSQTDSVISAKIPDPDLDPTVHKIIKSTMIHGPCGDLNKKSPVWLTAHAVKGTPALSPRRRRLLKMVIRSIPDDFRRKGDLR